MNVSKWKNTVAFLVMIAVNTLANLLSLGGNTTGEVSAVYPNLFTRTRYPVTVFMKRRTLYENHGKR